MRKESNPTQRRKDRKPEKKYFRGEVWGLEDSVKRREGNER